LLTPAVAVVVLVLGVGLGSTAGQSIGVLPVFGDPDLSLNAYRSVAEEPGLWRGLRLSLMIAAASTVIAVTVGVALAIMVHRSRTGGRLVGALATLTVPVPHLVGAAAIGLLLSDSGLVARLVGADPNTFPALVAGPWWVAVVVEFAWKESAFVAIVVLAALAADERELTEAAATLGAAPRQQLRRVTLPLAAPAVVAAGGIAFAYVLGSYEVAWLLGQVYPEPLPVLAYRLSTDIDLTVRTQAMVVALVTSMLAAGSLAASAVLFRRQAVLR
jgi:putative spermidine/putrescine transport system permease protein